MRAIRERWGVALLAPLAIAAAGLAQDTPASKPSEAIFEKTCSACHTADSVVSARRTRDQWQETIDAMVTQQGAKIADEEFGPILEYLVATYGKVNVNTAPAAEIAQIAGLSQKEADAVVKYRKEHGKFEDFEALAKVPDVDARKLEKSRDALAF